MHACMRAQVQVPPRCTPARPPQAKEIKASTSSLEFKLHPLVLINVGDHYTRTRANTGNAATCVLGILLGSQAGRTIDIRWVGGWIGW